MKKLDLLFKYVIVKMMQINMKGTSDSEKIYFVISLFSLILFFNYFAIIVILDIFNLLKATFTSFFQVLIPFSIFYLFLYFVFVRTKRYSEILIDYKANSLIKQRANWFSFIYIGLTIGLLIFTIFLKYLL
jgi:hypothetical protein